MNFGISLLSKYKFKGIAMVSAGIFLAVLSSFIALSGILWNKSEARLELYLGDEKRTFEGETIEHMTVLDAMYAVSLAGNITFEYSIDPAQNKTHITALDGYTYSSILVFPDFYLNSERIEATRIHSILIKPGDVIVVKAE